MGRTAIPTNLQKSAMQSISKENFGMLLYTVHMNKLVICKRLNIKELKKEQC